MWANFHITWFYLLRFIFGHNDLVIEHDFVFQSLKTFNFHKLKNIFNYYVSSFSKDCEIQCIFRFDFYFLKIKQKTTRKIRQCYLLIHLSLCARMVKFKTFHWQWNYFILY